MADLPEANPQLAGFIARRLTVLLGQDWSSLSKDEQKAQKGIARKLLAAERRFLARPDAEAEDVDEVILDRVAEDRQA